MSVVVKGFFHEPTWTLSYVVFDNVSKKACVIDPVMDFDYFSGRTGCDFSDTQLAYIKENELELVWVLETHAHADHISGAQYIKAMAGGVVAIGEGIVEVQQTFKGVFNLDSNFSTGGDQFDRLVSDGEKLPLGEAEISVLATPGHTNDSVSYLIGDNLFVGDTIFMPDGGTARCDFPGGNAAMLYESIHKLYQLPDETKVWVCHDYQPDGRELRYQSTIGEQKRTNIHVMQHVSKNDFVVKRERRDATLDMPKLILPSIQVNIRAGVLPDKENNETSYLKLPLDKF